jgi:hypothetical protein
MRLERRISPEGTAGDLLILGLQLCRMGEIVGWVERSDTHQRPLSAALHKMGFESAQPILRGSLIGLLDALTQIRLFGKLKLTNCALISGLSDISIFGAQVGPTRLALISGLPEMSMFGAQVG